ncbi:MAG TPA: hypothetical protein VGW78_06310 [Candidatus Babeliales bacterium]|nr:hypothetical protein [Candidatus Babeliales bacterium]
MNIILFAILLCVNTNLISVHNRSPETFYKKQIIARAKENMPAELKTCKNLAEVKKLLRQEEATCYKEIQNAFNIPDNMWHLMMQGKKAHKKYTRKILLQKEYPSIDHSLAEIDPDQYQYLVQILTLYGINSNAVNITYNKEELEKYNHPAHAAQNNYFNNGPAEISCHPLDKAKATYKAELIARSIHEAMHLFDSHHYMIILLGEAMVDYISTEQFQESKQYKDLRIMHEKIADIMPLLKFQNKEHIQALFTDAMNSCLNKVYDKKGIRWDPSCTDDGIHPCRCDVILPWVLKIMELLPAEQQQST